MKKYFPLIALFVLLLYCNPAHAQIVGSVAEGSGNCTLPNGLASLVLPPDPQPPFILNAQTLSLSYYIDSLLITDWIFPAIYNPFEIVALGERITLPTDSGYIDSIAVRIDSVGGDSIQIALVGDTVYSIAGSGRSFHLMNIFKTPFNFYNNKYISTASVHVGSFTVIPMNHVKAPKNFFVFIAPHGVVTGYPPSGWSLAATSVLRLAGDHEASHARTLDNTRSAFIGVDQSNFVYSVILDSTFILNGHTDIAFTNLYTTAFVDTAGFTGVEEDMSPSRDIIISNYPNPFSSSTQLKIKTTGYDHPLLKIYDAIGREVSDLTSQISRNASPQVVFNGRNLPGGVYYARLQSGQVSVTKSLLLLK